jgi:hypothetical protein
MHNGNGEISGRSQPEIGSGSTEAMIFDKVWRYRLNGELDLYQKARWKVLLKSH